MKFNVTNVFYKNVDAINEKKRIITNYGGSSSSKTISVLQLFRLLAESKADLYFLLIARSVPKLKTTLLKDFKNVVMKNDYDTKSFNKEDKIYTFPNNSVFKFANAYDEDTYKGVRSDFAMLDECNTYRNGLGVFNQIEIRCDRAVFPIFNPSAKFWIIDVMKRADAISIHSTYKDNPYISDRIRKSLESRAKTDRNFYNVYALGKWGSLSGLIFNEVNDFKEINETSQIRWKKYKDLPGIEFWHGIGLDFGGGGDNSDKVNGRSKTVMLSTYINKTLNEIYVKLHIYKGYIETEDVAKELDKFNNIETLVDNARADKVTELQNKGYLIIPAKSKEGKSNSVLSGYDILRQYKIFIQESDFQIHEEWSNHKWKEDNKGEITEVVEDKYKDVADALRYIVTYYHLNYNF